MICIEYVCLMVVMYVVCIICFFGAQIFFCIKIIFLSFFLSSTCRGCNKWYKGLYFIIQLPFSNFVNSINDAFDIFFRSTPSLGSYWARQHFQKRQIKFCCALFQVTRMTCDSSCWVRLRSISVTGWRETSSTGTRHCVNKIPYSYKWKENRVLGYIIFLPLTVWNF